MSIYLYTSDGQVTGPHDPAALHAAIQRGQLDPQTQAAREGSQDWRPLVDLIGPSKPAQVVARRADSPPARPTTSPGGAAPLSLRDLRARTAYPLIRLLANFVALLGIALGLVLIGFAFFAHSQSGGGIGLVILFIQGSLTILTGLLMREAMNLGADIADRLHQTAK